MKALLLTILISLGVVCANAQDTIGLKSLVCRFKVPRTNDNHEDGTGFIITRQGDSLYLVTAGHIFREYKQGAPIAVTLNDNADTLYAKLKMCHDPLNGDKEDLAICSVLSKDYHYPVVLPLDTLQAHIPVFYFRNKHLYAESYKNKQTLNTFSDSTHTYNIYMPYIEGGDSGGPVFTCGAPRLAGIILKGDVDCEVLNISQIITIIKKELPGLTL
jgi:hypothetical protein